MANTSKTSALANKLGTGNLKQSIGSIGAYQQIMQAFVNYITSVGVPPQLPANDNVPASVTNSANTAITQLGADFKAAQATASGLSSQINGITDLITAAATYTRHSEITINQITQTLIDYKNTGQLDRDQLVASLTRMAQNAQRFQSSVQTAHTNTDSAVKSLQTWEAKLNSDFEALQNAIPPADGKVLNLSTLTEAQAAKQLSDQVDSLNSEIASLQSEINWLTFGEVSTGIVGGLIAVTNFWNPIGWAAAGLTVYGEIEMVGKKANDTAQMNTDLQNLALTEDEQAILHPLYSIKNAVAQLGTGINAAEAISKELLSMSDDFSAAADDLESFISDVTSNASVSDLQSDATYVKSDYDTLLSLCNSLLTPVPTQIVSQTQMTKVVNANIS